MKPIHITVLMLLVSFLITDFALASSSSVAPVRLDTTKKNLATKDIKHIKKVMKNGGSKNMSHMVIKIMTNDSVSNLKDMPSLMVKMNYTIEKSTLVSDFENDSFHNARERREAKKELSGELRELKKQYKRELKESRQEEKKMKEELKR